MAENPNLVQEFEEAFQVDEKALYLCVFSMLKISVSDPLHFNADPDPTWNQANSNFFL